MKQMHSGLIFYFPLHLWHQSAELLYITLLCAAVEICVVKIHQIHIIQRCRLRVLVQCIPNQVSQKTGAQIPVVKTQRQSRLQAAQAKCVLLQQGRGGGLMIHLSIIFIPSVHHLYSGWGALGKRRIVITAGVSVQGRCGCLRPDKLHLCQRRYSQSDRRRDVNNRLIC